MYYRSPVRGASHDNYCTHNCKKSTYDCRVVKLNTKLRNGQWGNFMVNLANIKQNNFSSFCEMTLYSNIN